MPPGSLENPYQTSQNNSSVHNDADREAQRYRRLAHVETIFGVLLLVLAAGLLVLAVSFVVWAVRQGNVPLLGLCMASAIRVVAALVVGLPGGLLLIAARSAYTASINKQDASMRSMRMAHKILIVGFFSIPLLLGGAILAFFVALGLSNM